MRLCEGQQLGPYKIASMLGAGGMGEVYKARDTRLGRDVAIKISHEAFTERFEREARLISQLNHPNVCQLYDISTDYLVMEYVDGRPISGPVPLPKALEYAVQICSALDAAHSKGIVHRDLKPDNILLARTGIKLVDFGIAKAESIVGTPSGPDRTQTVALTNETAVVGTLQYMSPEQLQGKLVDTRSDIFSFGTVLYELVTGERPFKGENAANLIAAVLTAEPRALTEIQPNMPATLDRVLKACLAKDPEDRWQSVRDLKRELEWISTGADVPPVAPRTSVISKRILFPLLAAICIAAGAPLWYLLRPNIPVIPPWKVSPLTAYAGIEQMPAMSPAGDQVAFVWDGERQDNDDIYLKRIDDEGPPLRLTSTHQSEYAPCWSPDGQRLAFLREQAGGTDLIVASSLGGGERVYGTFKGMLRRTIPSTLSWSGDGRHIALANVGLFRVDVETREVNTLTPTPPPGHFDSMPSYAPDARTVAFTRGTSAVNRQMWVQKLDRQGHPTGSPNRVTQESSSFIGCTWLPARKALLSSRGFPGSFLELLLIPLGGGSSEPVPVEASAAWYPSYSATTGRLVYQRRWLDLNILRVSLDDHGSKPVPVVASTHLDHTVDVSLDGKRVVFSSTRDRRSGIWRSERDGTNQVRLAVVESGPAGSPRWSPDGKWVVFDGGMQGSNDLYMVSSDGGKPRQLTKTAEGEFAPAFSADGKRVYYSSAASGRDEIWVIRLDDGKSQQLTHRGGQRSLASSDGKWVYYNRERSVWRVPVDGGLETKILDGVGVGSWTVAGTFVYVLRPGERSAVLEVEPNSGTSKVAYEFSSAIEPTYHTSSIAVSAVTREAFVQYRVREDSDLMLVENFW